MLRRRTSVAEDPPPIGELRRPSSNHHSIILSSQKPPMKPPKEIGKRLRRIFGWDAMPLCCVALGCEGKLFGGFVESPLRLFVLNHNFVAVTAF